MSARIKIQLSRIAIFSTLTVTVFFSVLSIGAAQGVGDFTATAQTVADMNAMQLLAYIALASIGALVVVVGFYVRSVSSFQKETAEALASITKALEDMGDNCRQACKR